MDQLQPYPAIIDSGVPWVGVTPAHWSIRRLKHAVHRIVGGSTPASGEAAYWDGEVVWVTPADISKTERLTTSLRKISREGLAACSASLIPSGSLVITSRAPIGNVALAEVDLCTNQGCKTLVPSDLLDAEFALRLFQILKRELESLGTGTTFAELSTSALGALPIPVPPRTEQTAIVRFLDHADRRIRRAIRAKQKLIALLNELKQAVIHRAVTRGLDPNVRLKRSGVDWLGDVPEHWEVLPLKRAVSTRITDGPHETPEFVAAGIDFLSAEAMVDGRLDSERRRGYILREAHETYCRKLRPHRDDIFMCKSGATTGKVAIVETDDEFSVWSPLALVRVDPQRALPRFMYAVLQARYVQRQVQDTWSYGTQPNLSMAAMERLVVALPPVAEQADVLVVLEKRLRSLRQAVVSAQEVIDLLREYRTRLIADVVTGKVDVRDAASRLPDKVDDLEPLDEIDVESGNESEVEDLETVEA
jgi:type I restriction enzyme S subunit